MALRMIVVCIIVGAVLTISLTKPLLVWLEKNVDTWWFVTVSHCVVFIPLGLYIFHDVIDSRWRRISEVRKWYTAYIYLNLLLYPMAALYFTGQVLTKDFQEAAAAAVTLAGNVYAMLKIFRGVKSTQLLRELAKRMWLADAEGRPHPYVGGLVDQVSSKLVDDDYPSESPRIRWVTLHWRGMILEKERVIQCRDICRDPNELVLIVTIWAFGCLCQGSKYDKFTADKYEMTKKRFQKRRLCWMLRALDRASVVGLMHAQGDKVTNRQDGTRDTSYDHSDDTKGEGRVGQTLAGPQAYDPAKAHFFLMSYQGMAVGSEDEDMSGQSSSMHETTFLASIPTLAHALTTKVFDWFKHQLADELPKTSGRPSGSVHWSMIVAARHMLLDVAHECIAVSRSIVFSPIQVPGQWRPVLSKFLRLTGLLEAPMSDVSARAFTLRVMHESKYAMEKEARKKKAPGHQLAKQKSLAGTAWQALRYVVHLSNGYKQTVQEREFRNWQGGMGRITVPSYVAAYTTSLLTLLASAGNTSIAEQQQQLANLPAEDFDHLLGSLRLAIIGIIDFHHRLAGVPPPKPAAPPDKSRQPPQTTQAAKPKEAAAAEPAPPTDLQATAPKGLHQACTVVLSVGTKLAMHDFWQEDSKRVSFQDYVDDILSNLPQAEKAIAAVLIDAFYHFVVPTDSDVLEPINEEEEKFTLVGHMLQSMHAPERGEIGSSEVLLFLKRILRENEGFNLRATMMMVLSFAAVICSATAMKVPGTKRQEPSAPSSDVPDTLLLSALHHAVSSGLEYILNAVADPACKGGMLGEGLRQLTSRFPITCPSGQAAVQSTLREWGIAGPEEIEVDGTDAMELLQQLGFIMQPTDVSATDIIWRLTTLTLSNSAQSPRYLTAQDLQNLGPNLAKLASLRTLHVSGCSLDDAAALAVTHLTSLSILQTLKLIYTGNRTDVKSAGAVALCDLLNTLTDLRTLEYEGGNSVDNPGKSFATLGRVTAMTSLRTLKLHNNLVDTGFRLLGSFLQHMPLLNTLDVGGNELGPEGAKAFGKYLTTASALRTLSVSDNTIGPETIAALAPHLADMPSLLTLYVSENSIGDEGASALAPHLASMTSLRTLSIRHNNIGDEGAKALGPHLATMTALKTLYLNENSIHSEGAIALAPYLAEMTSLRVLDLDSNDIRDEGAKAMAPYLAKVTSLRKLNLASNGIREDGVRALAPYLDTMVLHELVIYWDDITPDVKSEIEDLLRRHAGRADAESSAPAVPEEVSEAVDAVVDELLASHAAGGLAISMCYKIDNATKHEHNEDIVCTTVSKATVERVLDSLPSNADFTSMCNPSSTPSGSKHQKHFEKAVDALLCFDRGVQAGVTEEVQAERAVAVVRAAVKAFPPPDSVSTAADASAHARGASAGQNTHGAEASGQALGESVDVEGESEDDSEVSQDIESLRQPINANDREPSSEPEGSKEVGNGDDEDSSAGPSQSHSQSQSQLWRGPSHTKHIASGATEVAGPGQPQDTDAQNTEDNEDDTRFTLRAPAAVAKQTTNLVLRGVAIEEAYRLNNLHIGNYLLQLFDYFKHEVLENISKPDKYLQIEQSPHASPSASAHHSPTPSSG